MGAIYAELRVAGHVFLVLKCTYGVHQATDRRGRVIEQVRFEPVTLVMDVPRGDFLLAWAAAAAKRLPAVVVFLDAAGGHAIETLTFVTGAYCVDHREEFWAGDATSGAYLLYLTLSDPDGFTMHAGGPASAFVAPAARDHGVPVAAAVSLVPIGGRGPTGFGDTKGQYSGRPYDPEGAGGPIQNLDWRAARIDPAGIAQLRQHVSRFGRILANEKMIARLEKIAAGTLPATDFDKRYYTHELREHERYQNAGVPDGANPSYETWNDAHTATLEDFKLNEEAEPLYHPEVAEEDFFTEL